MHLVGRCKWLEACTASLALPALAAAVACAGEVWEVLARGVYGLYCHINFILIEK